MCFLMAVSVVGAARLPLLEADDIVYINGNGSLAQRRSEVIQELIYNRGWDEKDAQDFCASWTSNEDRARQFKKVDEAYRTRHALRQTRRSPLHQAFRTTTKYGARFGSALMTKMRGRGAPPPQAAEADDDFVDVTEEDAQIEG